ncbi:MAG: helix-turn-helix transcriptional regulator [Deltaproteobacteria bacterium]|nr:helix-turn-helix transcriptional regulator [Deltaproteobacteria bacterium]
MSLFHLMDIAESLLQLDPVRTYPQRGAELVAKAVRAGAWRAKLDHHDDVESDPAPTGEPTITLPLRHGREVIGSLDLFHSEDSLDEDEMRVARWAARVYSRALSYAERLATEGGRSAGANIEEALRRAPLTPRERDVVALLVSGSSTKAIASTTGLTVSTVNTYLKRIFSKLGVHSRVELVARVAGTDSSASATQPRS